MGRLTTIIASVAARASAWGHDPRAARGEGSARVGRSAHQGPLTLTLSPQGEATGRPHGEQMDFVAVVQDAWTVEKGFVTPTMKVKRNVIEERYGGMLDGWYAKKQPVIWQ